MIQFNKPVQLENGTEYLSECIKSGNEISGDGLFTKKCQEWMKNNFDLKKALLTTSCTHALELAAILLDIKPGDEIIAPSYTFVSTVNAFVLRGARVKFVDIRPDTMNINEELIESAITKNTKAIVPVHYAGVSCEMVKIMEISKKYNIPVVEDAAQAFMSKYDGLYLGTIGDMGTYSFHSTKNYTMGEGGAIIIQNPLFIERAEIVREKGTDRSKFLRGQVDKYTWVDIGSSFLPSEINAAYLFPQLEKAIEINNNRLASWRRYYNNLKNLKDSGRIELPYIPDNCEHNAHMFYIKCKDINERTSLMDYLRNKGIKTAFHYVPLHSSLAGRKYGDFIGDDNFTTKESERLLRLPMYYNISNDDIDYVSGTIEEFYNNIIFEV